MNPLYLNKVLIDWDKLDKSSYVRNIPALSGVDEIEFNTPITFFVGENGSGKSTLLESMAIAAGFSPEGGTLNYLFSTYDDYSELYKAITLARGYRKYRWGYFLRAESFYNVATMDMEYGEEEGATHNYHEKSHGESFISVLQDNLSRDGLFLLDEPEAALSPQRQLTLLLEMVNHAKQGAQFVVVTHSPILLGTPDAEIYSFNEGALHTVRYEDTESYIVTKSFLNNRSKILDELLK